MRLMTRALHSAEFGATVIASVIGSFTLFLGVLRSDAAPVRVAYSAISGAGTNSDAVDAVLQTEVKSGSAKAADFFDNSFISEMDREGFFRQLYR